MKTKRFWTVLAAVALLAASCDKDEDKKDAVAMGDALAASTEQLATRVALSGSDAGYDVVWSSGDKINVVPYGDVSQYNQREYVLMSGAGTTGGMFAPTETLNWSGCSSVEAFCGLTYNGQWMWPSAQRYAGADALPLLPMRHAKAPTYGSVPTLQFRSLGGLLRLSIKGNIVVRSIRISTSEKISGPIASYSAAGSAQIDQNSGGNTITLLVENVPLDSREATDFYIAMPVKTAGYDMTVTVVDTYGDSFSKSLADVEIGRGQITGKAFDIILPNVLNGRFTVNADGSKVRFSKTNLQAFLTVPRQWRFTTNQYDAEDGYTAGPRDLLAWSVPASDYGTLYVNPDHAKDKVFVEWGLLMQQNGFWRTPKAAEWTYILDKRTQSLRYAKARIAKDASTFVNGLLLFPDGFVCPSGITVAGANAAGGAFSTNTFDLTAWSSLEAAGCVFLPAGGYFEGDVKNYNVSGGYWASDASTKYREADCLMFDNTSLTVGPAECKIGHAVRLVTD